MILYAMVCLHRGPPMIRRIDIHHTTACLLLMARQVPQHTHFWDHLRNSFFCLHCKRNYADKPSGNFCEVMNGDRCFIRSWNYVPENPQHVVN